MPRRALCWKEKWKGQTLINAEESSLFAVLAIQAEYCSRCRRDAWHRSAVRRSGGIYCGFPPYILRDEPDGAPSHDRWAAAAMRR